MYIIEKDNQIIDDAARCGEGVKTSLSLAYITKIPKGTVMAYRHLVYPIFFQTLADLDVGSLKNTSIIYYEPGSVINAGFTKFVIPTFRFGLCGFPKFIEFEKYKTYAIV